MNNNKTPDRAWKLLSRRGSWTQKVSARDSHGVEVMVDSPDAVQFCAIGAIKRVHGSVNDIRNMAIRLRYKRLKKFLGSYVWEWNDKTSRSRKEVVAVLKHFGI